jgi:hypothetical protein
VCAALLEITPAAISSPACPRSWRPGPLLANSEHNPPILCTIALNRTAVVKTQELTHELAEGFSGILLRPHSGYFCDPKGGAVFCLPS